MATPTTTPGRHHRPATPSERQGRRSLIRRTSAVAAVALVVTGGTVALAEVTVPNPETLKAVGPISGEHGYPSYYMDANDVRLEQCLDVTDAYCDPAFLRGEMPDPDSPISFPTNWPLESFYFLAGSEFAIGDGKAVLTAGLEATMANEATQDGDQVVFGRLRFDIDFPSAGTYVVTHPYGVDTFTVDAAGDFRYVEDITPAPGNFGLALRSRIAPFLIDADGMHLAANGNKYVGAPGEETTVLGSPHGTNFFRIEQVNADDTKTLVGENNLFSLMGKVATNSGVTAQGAVLHQSAAGSYLDVFATTDAGESISVQGEGLTKTILDAQLKRYFGRLPLSSTIPTSVTISNDTDTPVATKTIPVKDGVMISEATYDTGTDTLTVTAASTDQVDPPTLQLLGWPAKGNTIKAVGNGTFTVKTTAAPARVTVRSTGKGTDTAPVTVSGGAASQPAETIALISGPVNVVTGEPVTLNDVSLNGENPTWTQTAGRTVDFTVGDLGRSISFPTVAGQEESFTFQLEVTGPRGAVATTWTVNAVNELPEPPPPAAAVAVATATPENAPLGQEVTVSGRSSTNAVSYEWTQTGGTPVSFDPAAASFSFAMPASDTPLTFSLVVKNSAGTASEPATATVTQVIDTLTVTSASYRADRSEWRLAGTASVTEINTVRIYLQNADGTRGTQVGQAVVAAPAAGETVGAWTFGVRNGVVPGATNRLMIESTRGGVLKNVSYTVR